MAGDHEFSDEERAKLRDIKRSYSGMFFNTAVDALDTAEQAEQVSTHLTKGVSSAMQLVASDDLIRILVAIRKRAQSSSTAIVFAALCLESLINAVLDAKLTR